MGDVTRNNATLAVAGTSATTAPTAGTSQTWTVAALPASFGAALEVTETLRLVDSTAGASAAQQAEIVLLTASTGSGATSITVTRGVESTTPVAHSVGATFAAVVTKAVFDAFLRTVDASNTYAPVKVLIGDSSGVLDTAAAMQTLITSLATSGGRIVIPAGTWLWSSVVPTVPPNMNKRLIIEVAAGATVKLTDGAPRFLDPGKVANHDIFQHLTITGRGTIDVNNVGGQHHTIFGTLLNGSWMTHVGFDDVLIEGLRVINAPVDPRMVAHRLHIWIVPRHNTSNETTQDRITNIAIRDLRLEGGNAGVGIAGVTGDGGDHANIYIDNVSIERVWHSLLAVQTASFASSNFHIGQAAYGGSAVIRDCVGLYSGDDAFEVNNLDSILLDNCVGVDSSLEMFLVKNFRTPLTPNKQRITLRNCRAEHIALETTTWSSGFCVRGAISAVHMDGCSYYRTGACYSDRFANAEALDVTPAAMLSFVCTKFRVVIEDALVNPSSTFAGVVCNIAPTNSPALNVTLRDWELNLSGTRDVSATFYKIWQVVMFAPTGTTSMTLNVDGMILDYGVTNAGSSTAQFLDFVSGDIRGALRRVVLSSTTDSTLAVVTVGTGIAAAARLHFQDTDINGTNAGLSIESGKAPQVHFTSLKRSIDPPAAVSIAPSASPYIYRNLDMVLEGVTVQGGTVSSIQYSVDGSTYWALGVTQGIINVQPGDYLKVTYSSVPTMTKVYAR